MIITDFMQQYNLQDDYDWFYVVNNLKDDIDWFYVLNSL